MKLDRSMIGKGIKRKLWEYPSELLGITANGEYIWLQGINNCPDTYSNDGDWFIEELKKLPSQRIRELYNPGNQSEAENVSLWIQAIVNFLDETLGRK